jgi:hypothetical protein
MISCLSFQVAETGLKNRCRGANKKGSDYQFVSPEESSDSAGDFFPECFERKDSGQGSARQL